MIGDYVILHGSIVVASEGNEHAAVNEAKRLASTRVEQTFRVCHVLAETRAVVATVETRYADGRVE